MSCLGTESTLSQCSHRAWGTSNCNHNEDAGVDCDVGTAGTADPIRLVGGTNNYEGRVEIQHGGNWGTICDDHWDDKAAQVACKQLGLTGTIGIPLTSAYFSNGTGNTGLSILLDDVACTGTESASGVNMQVRLAGGLNKYQGRVEVSVFGSTNPIVTKVPSSAGPTSLPIVMDHVRCVGTESSLAGCRYSKTNNCNHREDLGVDCQVGYSSLQVRLTGNTQRNNQGRVEVFYNNTWGTVCDDSFDNNDAAVICRQLGLNSSSALAMGVASYGQGTGQIWIDDLACMGTESNLASCRHSGTNAQVRSSRYYGSGNTSQTIMLDEVQCSGSESNIFYCPHAALYDNDCKHTEDVGVLCAGPGAVAVGASVYGAGSGRIILDDLQCSGTETSLAECGNKGLFNHNCRHSEDVGVQCSPGIIQIRLAGINRRRFDSGRVEIRLGRDWGTVCDDHFDANAARVVCKQLGYPSNGAIAVSTMGFGPGQGRILLDDVTCTGNETSILDCGHAPLGNNDCDHGEDAGVICGDRFLPGRYYDTGGHHEKLTSVNSTTSHYNRNCYVDRQANNNHNSKSDFYNSNDHFRKHDYYHNPNNHHYNDPNNHHYNNPNNHHYNNPNNHHHISNDHFKKHDYLDNPNNDRYDNNNNKDHYNNPNNNHYSSNG
nr:hypothetical protein BaRGS_016364 [Batillaria attramentaria]